MEEWNEYGELKEQLGSVAPAASTPLQSTSNTPSKPPTTTSAPSSTSTPSKAAPTVLFAENTPPKPSQSGDVRSRPATGRVETSFSLAMRQAGKEAAERAKLKPKSTGIKNSATPVADLSKLDNSAPTGLPPPSGVTEAASAKSVETGSADAVSKADDVPMTSANEVTTDSSNLNTEPEAPKKSTATPAHDSLSENAQPIASTDSLATSTSGTPDVKPAKGVSKHRSSSITAASKDEIKDVEESTKIEEEPEEEEKAMQETENATNPESSGSVQQAPSNDATPDLNQYVQSAEEGRAEVLDQVKTDLAQEPNSTEAETTDGSTTEKHIANQKAQKVYQDNVGAKPQNQSPTDPEKAGESVAD